MQHRELGTTAVSWGFGDVRSLIFARVGSLKWKGNKLDLRALRDEWEVKERGERDRGCWRETWDQRTQGIFRA